MKIYTKTGDDGMTSLIGGSRVPKCDMRVAGYGAVDELSAFVAMLGDMMREDGRFGGIVGRFDDIQKDLFTIEAMMAVGEVERPDGKPCKRLEGLVADLPQSAVDRLERQIDEMGEGLPTVEGFVIPGGHPIVSQCHICRTVCREAERLAVRLQYSFDLPPVAVQYLNRFSDWLYVVGRKAVEILSLKESYWTPEKF